MAFLRVPQARPVRGMAPAEGRPFMRRRRRRVSGALPQPGTGSLGQRGARGGVPGPQVHPRDGSFHTFPCALADIGRCGAPCDGRIGPGGYRAVVGRLVAALAAPDDLLAALDARMAALAEQERFEEAAGVRDRLRALAEVLWRARVDRWLTTGTLTLRTTTGVCLHLRAGSLLTGGETSFGGGAVPGPIGTPPPRDRADELAALRSWVCRHATTVVACDVAPAEPVAGGRRLAETLRRLRASADGRDDRRHDRHR